MDINLLLIFLQLISVLVAFASAMILFLTIRSNKELNRNNLFNELVKQERELRIKLNEYRKEIHQNMDNNVEKEIWSAITLEYDTLLFNYYEYLAVCINKELINEKPIKKYFKQLLMSVAEQFESSILFEEHFAKKGDYLGIQWLIKRWKV
ncbi:hypothetical protein HOD29_04825 [archaeon]|jgi:hypothetical protein|nr:hypothetical protein [archaeon]